MGFQNAWHVPGLSYQGNDDDFVSIYRRIDYVVLTDSMDAKTGIPGEIIPLSQGAMILGNVFRPLV